MNESLNPLMDAEPLPLAEPPRVAASKLAAQKSEAELLARYQDFLEQKDHQLRRFMFKIPGSSSVLLTDLFDETANVLYEVKGSTDRASVRMAGAQLTDYARFIEPRPSRLAIVLPSKPHDDLIDLIESQGMIVVYQDGEDFIGAPI